MKLIWKSMAVWDGMFIEMFLLKLIEELAILWRDIDDSIYSDVEYAVVIGDNEEVELRSWIWIWLW